MILSIADNELGRQCFLRQCQNTYSCWELYKVYKSLAWQVESALLVDKPFTWTVQLQIKKNIIENEMKTHRLLSFMSWEKMVRLFKMLI